MPDNLNKIEETTSNEKEIVEKLKKSNRSIGDNTPVIGYFDEHGITILTAEEEKLW